MSDQYEGMIIHHLEDFSNKVTLNANHPAITHNRDTPASVQRISTNNQILRSFLGNIGTICYGSPGIGSSGDGFNGSVGSSPRLKTMSRSVDLGADSDLLMEVATVRSRNLSGDFLRYDNDRIKAVPRIGIEFTLPPETLNKRTILSFDYRPIDGPLKGTFSGTVDVTRVCIGRNGNPGTQYVFSSFELFNFANRHLPGKLEFIFESGRLRTYFRNKLISDIAYSDRTLFFGEVWGSTKNTHSMYINTVNQPINVPDSNTPFAISNLALVSVPLESPIRRLGNCRIQRSLVNDLDGTVQDETSALNGDSTNDGKSLEVDHVTQTIKFAPIELEDGENIIGTQMVLSGTNTETGSNLETIVYNGVEELTDVTHTLIETHLSREVIGDFILGEQPEDYSEVALEVRSVEV